MNSEFSNALKSGLIHELAQVSFQLGVNFKHCCAKVLSFPAAI